MTKIYIYVGHVSNASGSGYTATFGEPDENRYAGRFYKTSTGATRAAVRLVADAKRAEGIDYEIGGPFADRTVLNHA